MKTKCFFFPSNGLTCGCVMYTVNAFAGCIRYLDNVKAANDVKLILITLTSHTLFCFYFFATAFYLKACS